MSKDLISIIIPTFNRADLIGETLDSVLAQTYTNWECIIVDDGSTDNTFEVIQKYVNADSRFKYFSRPADRPNGGNACRNFGFEMSRGEFINWFDSDDVLMTEHISFHLSHHAKNSSDAVVSSASVFESDYTNIVRSWNSVGNIKESTSVLDDMVSEKVIWPINCVSWKRDAVPISPFNESLYSSQEWTFHLNQLLTNKTCIIFEEITCLIRSHDKRIGKILSDKKNLSTYTSRKSVLLSLRLNKMLTKKSELALLHRIFNSLRLSLLNKHYHVVLKIVNFLFFELYYSTYKKKIINVILIASPLYLITKKGEKLFKFSKTAKNK